jgi:DNA-directed RNA polymerase sigma subunit (sigma70/sigma32)
MSKLSEYDVLSIRAELENGVSRKELALRYGVATETVAKIARRNTFVNVGTPAVPDTRMEEMAAASQAKIMQAARELQTKMGENASADFAEDKGALSSETLGLLLGA